MAEGRTYERRIQLANLRDLPSVLDTTMAANVLGLSVARVRKLTADPRDAEQMNDELLLHRLAYTSDFLYDVREVRRFMRAWSSTPVRREAS